MYDIEGKRIFVFGGAYSIDKAMRTPGKSWWPDEMPLNGFLEFIRERLKYKHWYMEHLHRDEDVWRHQTILWFSLRNMETNEEYGE